MLFLIMILGSIVSCDRMIYVGGTIHLAEYIDEEDRSFGFDEDSIGPGEELRAEKSPVISLELSSELEEVVITDSMSATVGVRVDVETYTGEVDLNLCLKAFISDLDEPGIWDESPAFEIVLEHILDSQSNYSESSYDLLERFQEVIHTAEPVYLALEATLENVGGGGSYSGRFTVEVLDIRYAGHKEL